MINILANTEDAIECLWLGSLITAKEWARAAIVYALTDSQHGRREVSFTSDLPGGGTGVFTIGGGNRISTAPSGR